MTKEEMIRHLNGDLANEYTHMLFYLHSAACVVGLHREEYKEFLLKQAASEMEHVREFSDLIVGLEGVPEIAHHPIPTLVTPEQIIEHAVGMEGEVLANYLTRMQEAQTLGGEDGMAVQLFLEEQFSHSREDRDHMKQMLIRI